MLFSIVSVSIFNSWGKVATQHTSTLCELTMPKKSLNNSGVPSIRIGHLFDRVNYKKNHLGDVRIATSLRIMLAVMLGNSHSFKNK